MDTTYSLRQVADLTGEPVFSIRNWSRLPATHRRHLPTSKDVDGHRTVTLVHTLEWLSRNPDLAERVLGVLAPPQLRGLFGLDFDHFNLDFNHASHTNHTHQEGTPAC